MEGLSVQFVANPNLPEGPVSLVVVDSRISDVSARSLEKLGARVMRMPAHPALYDAVCCHPDMMLHHIGDGIIVHAPETDEKLLDELRTYGFSLVQGQKTLTGTYPGDIAYNVARIGKYYFHNLRYTDPVLANLLERQNIEPVHVAQGYTKCSVLAVDENSIITADAGIANAAAGKGFDVLFLKCADSIRLPGLNYGFIGGACGMLSEKLLAINGALRKMRDNESFISFLSKRHIQIAELSDEDVTDIRSILPLMVSPYGN